MVAERGGGGIIDVVGYEGFIWVVRRMVSEGTECIRVGVICVLSVGG